MVCHNLLEYDHIDNISHSTISILRHHFYIYVNNQYFLSENMQKVVFHRSLLGVTTNVVLNFILIKPYGAIGAAIATLSSQFAVSILHTVMHKKSRVLFFLALSSVNPRNIFLSTD